MSRKHYSFVLRGNGRRKLMVDGWEGRDAPPYSGWYRDFAGGVLERTATCDEVDEVDAIFLAYLL
jgi:hypothetical protein